MVYRPKEGWTHKASIEQRPNNSWRATSGEFIAVGKTLSEAEQNLISLMEVKLGMDVILEIPYYIMNC